MKVIGRVLVLRGILVFIGVIVIFVAITAVYHHIALKSEADRIKPNGQMVEMGNYQVHVYTEGKSTDNPTLVFLSGSATVAPVYDFKGLYAKLSNDYHIAVVEKAGYGYADIVDVPRDIDSLLDEVRGALTAAGEAPPYVLVPHSMSGLEAVYWAQKHPNEAAAIVGIDMANPISYESFDEKQIARMATLGNMAIKLGLHRIPGIYPLSTQALSDKEIEQQKLLMARNAVNIDYLNEGRAVLNNAKKVDGGPVIQCPVLLFVSNGKEVGDFWITSQQQFAEQTGAEVISYDCGHYIHHEKSEDMAEQIRLFLVQ